MKKMSKDGKKWLSVVAVLLAIILALGITLGFATKWGKDLENLKPKKEETALVEGGMTLPEEAEGSGVALVSAVIPRSEYEEYGIATIAQSAYTVTATVKVGGQTAPDYMNKVTWSMAWKTSSSASLSTYVTMQTTDTTATFSCLKAFTTQIVVTCKAVTDESASATVTLDYLKPITSITAQFNDGSVETVTSGSKTITATFPVEYGTASHDGNSTWNGEKLLWYKEINYGDGTTTSAYPANPTVTITPSSALQTKYNSLRSSSLGADMATSLSANKSSSSSWDAIKSVSDFYRSLTKSNQGLWGMGAASALCNSLATTTNQFTVQVAFGEKKTFTYTLNVSVESQPSATLTVDKSKIVFEA